MRTANGSMVRAALLASALALGAAGCSDATGLGWGTSYVRFDHDGPVSGRFHAEGDALNDLWGSYAYGISYYGSVEIRGSARVGNGLVDLVELTIPARGTGTFRIDDAACPWWDEGCPGAFVAFDVPADQGPASYSCGLLTGTIRVTTLSSRRAAGEFAGSGDCVAAWGERIYGFTIRNGRFDVELR